MTETCDGKNTIPLHREIIAFSVLAMFLLATIILCHNQSMEIGSIEKVIEARVAQEFTERYHSVPVIQNPKYVTVYNGREVIVEE